MNDIHKLIVELARARDVYAPRIAALEAELVAVQTRLAEQRTALDTVERATRELIEAYVRETGDLSPHPAVAVRRKTKLQYDKAEALEWAKQHAPACVRVKEELDVRAFEKIADGWNCAERVRVVEIAIAVRLGDVLAVEDGRNAHENVAHTQGENA